LEILSSYKRSAIHNLGIEAGERRNPALPLGDIGEGLALPMELMTVADLAIGESVIVARIGSGNQQNRVRTFVVPSADGRVATRGSLGYFLSPGDLVCVISETRLDEAGRRMHQSGDLPVLDFGITPGGPFDSGRLVQEYLGRPDEATDLTPGQHRLRETLMPRIMLQSLITDLVVNQTDENCLLGSAEIPGRLMDMVGMTRHAMVTVFNASTGGCTDTYAVPMAPRVVMTTGAMASFAPLGTTVHVATFCLTSRRQEPMIAWTDGNDVLP
jgi:aspartate 1-decarboxylase